MQTEVEIMNPYASYLMFTFLYIWLLAVGLLGLVICKYPAATRDGTTFSEAMSLNKLVVSCTSEYDKALVSPVLSFIPTTNLPPCELLNATNSQAISYL